MSSDDSAAAAAKRVALVTGAGRRVGQTVSLVDLFPTFVELAGLEDGNDLEAQVDGDSLCGLSPLPRYAVTTG